MLLQKWIEVMSCGRREPKLVLEFIWPVKNRDLASGAVIITSP